MNKYIQDTIRNNSRFILKAFTVPQCKAVSEVIRGLFTVSTPILRHLAQNREVSAKKQGDKYSYHLGQIDVQTKVEEHALNKVRFSMRKNTIIAYDLTDISKEAAQKMENLSKVFDGSKRKVTKGFTLHGLGVNNVLLKLDVHNGEKYTQNQVRREIVHKYTEEFKNKGIWVFDRGNDDKQFFKFLRHHVNVQFIARLRSNRGVVLKGTGAIIQIKELPVGKYEVYLMDKNNNAVDMRGTYTLIIADNLQDKEPMRLLCSLQREYSSEEIKTMYLERWGIENIFKRAKTKFNLEKIRVLNYQKFVNIIALIQFAINVSTITFLAIQKSTYSLISGVLLCYKRFLLLKALTCNIDSFISYLKYVLKPLVVYPKKPPPQQLPLLSWRQAGKLGPF